jgi:two-component system, chemotaxis family, protein-glutamate methylesterase/glutaminase
VHDAPPWIVVFGATSGGPQALVQILRQFPAGFPGTVVVAQHMRPGFERVLAQQLQPVCNLPVIALQDRQPLQSSRIVVTSSLARIAIDAGDDFLSDREQLVIEELGDSQGAVPNRVDTLMTSAVAVFRSRTIGVLLTGLGSDGREGMRAIRAAGGVTIAQDQATSVVFALPSSAIEVGIVDEVLPLWGIVDQVNSHVGGKTGAYAA